MDTARALELIKSGIELGAAALKLGQDVSPFALALWNNLVNKKVITSGDLDLLEAQLKAMSNRLQAPLPPTQYRS